MTKEVSNEMYPHVLAHGIITLMVDGFSQPVEVNVNAIYVNNSDDGRIGAKELAEIQQCLQQCLKDRHKEEEWEKIRVVDICVANIVDLGSFNGNKDFQRGVEDLVAQAEQANNERKAADIAESLNKKQSKIKTDLSLVKGDNLEDLLDAD